MIQKNGAMLSMDNKNIKTVSMLLFSLFIMVLATSCATTNLTPSTSPEAGSQPMQPTAAVSPAITSTPTPDTFPPTSTPLAIDDAMLQNMTYQLGIIQQALPGSDGKIKLTDGHFEQRYSDSASGVSIDYILGATGDLNGDGSSDGIALLGINTGGSGEFVYLVGFLNENGQPEQIAVKYLGDRTKIEALAIDGGDIKIRRITHAPEDPLCCPSQDVTEDYILRDNQLVTTEQSEVLPLANAAIQALAAKDMDKLAKLASPSSGLRFSPYSFVRPEDLAFSPEQLRGLLDDPTVYMWGTFDGSGEPIQMTFAEYYERFVYSKDFASADQIGLNERLGQGNTIDNSQEFYPDAVVVEYHLPGENPDYSGMDWQSLRLVFQQQEGQWYLVGIIHDEWTT
jgi:hypothetical protein